LKHALTDAVVSQKIKPNTHQQLPFGQQSTFGLKADIVDAGIPQSLFAAEITVGRLDANVPKEELNLFEFSPSVVTQARMCGEGRAEQLSRVRNGQKLV
jgi:hypothetical protein